MASTPDMNDASSANAGQRIKDAAASAVDAGKSFASDKLPAGAEGAKSAADSAVTALRRAGDEMPSEQAWLGQGLRASADAIERARASMSGNMDEAVQEVCAFARRQPALFIGAGIALGFALARVGKTAMSSSQAYSGQEYSGQASSGVAEY